MSKLVIIGAGSTVFVKDLIGDLLTFKDVLVDTVSLVDINSEKLEVIEKLLNRMCKQEGKKIKIEATTERKEVLRGADYVINTIEVAGAELYRKDLEIPDKYGIIQVLGDTLGPGGVFRGLRIIPEILNICRDIENLCPNAILFNYSNPMAMVYMAIKKSTTIETYGLCHCVQGTAMQLANYLRVPLKDLSYLCAGINHMGWFLQIKVNGKDAYPKLREISSDHQMVEELSKFEKFFSERAARNKIDMKAVDFVRFELLHYFGYFVNESSWHVSEYVPYFRKNEDLIRELKIQKRWWLEHVEGIDNTYNDLRKLLQTNEKIEIKKSVEYFPDIIRALQTGEVFNPNINVLNTGLINNLPYGCCIEVPCLVDSSGIHPCYIGDLPEQCAALNRSNINVQIMAVEAVLEKNKEKKRQYIKQAIALDPLTSSILTLPEIDKMVGELIEANKDFLGM